MQARTHRLAHNSRTLRLTLIGILAWCGRAGAAMEGPDIGVASRVILQYTVQIQAAPAAGKDQVVRTYEALKTKGHLVYYYRAFVDGRSYIHLRTGFFKDRDQAQAYAETLRQAEGFDGFVAQSDLPTDSFGQVFDVVTTPNDIWLQSTSSLRVLYHFDSEIAAGDCSPVRISPNDRYIVFSCDNKILTIDRVTAAVTVLKQGQDAEGLSACAPAWSPDGRFIAYLDNAEWEVPTALWVMRSDGSEDRLLIGDATRQTAVKSFHWDPKGNGLFYVCGPTYGTVTVGGSLYRTDLAGHTEVLVAASPTEHTEVSRDFRTWPNQIDYRLAHFNTHAEVEGYTGHSIPLPPVDK